MTIKAPKKLQLITALLFILTIVIIIIGLILIDFFHTKEIITSKRYYDKKLIIKNNGFDLLRNYNLTFLLNHYKLNNTFGIINVAYENQLLLQLQIGIILLIIISPILTLITISLFFLIIGLKIKIKNNNFWDAIQNCEIINNYYIH